MSNIVIQKITEIKMLWPLRHKILRPEQPIAAVQYPEDNNQGVVHFGAYKDKDLVGICSLYPESNVDLEKIGWRLRGMAVDPAMRKRNIGAALLNACYEYVDKQPRPKGIWCNARSNVMQYYLNNGFVTQGEEFIMPNIGPHFLMINWEPKVTTIEIKS